MKSVYCAVRTGSLNKAVCASYLIKDRNIINYVKSERLSWSGHINRMPETEIVKKIYKWHPITNRPVGRRQSRWEDDVKNDLKKLKVVKWSDQIQDRHKWKETVENSNSRRRRRRK
jgi:hypothetical protein